ncbi:MAG: hypothetical protein ACPGWR_21735 [Ardenticatenaceae bacterium]
MLKRPRWLKNERFFVKKEVWLLRLRYKVLLGVALLLLLWTCRTLELRLIGHILNADYTGKKTEVIAVEGWKGVTFEHANSIASLYHGQPIYVILREETDLETDYGFELDRPKQSQQNLVDAGVDPDDVILMLIPEREDVPGQTSYYASELRKRLLQDGIKSYTLATVWYHSQRSCLTYGNIFAQTGIEIDCYPLPKEYGPDDWWQSRTGLIEVVTESMKFAYYTWRGFR